MEITRDGPGCICRYMDCTQDEPAPMCNCNCHDPMYGADYAPQRWPESGRASYCTAGGWNGSTPEYSTRAVCPACKALTTESDYIGHLEWHQRTGTLSFPA